MMTWQDRLALRDPSLHVHLIAIGGAGLSAIATVLLEMGIRVSGSDRQMTPTMMRLADAGARVYEKQVAENLTSLEADARPDVVLISSAIAAENPERRAAEELGLPVVKRAEFLPVLLANRHLIAVAGTHGKSTTTSMIVKVLREAGIEAGYIIGAHLPGYGNAAAGTHSYFVLEADEYDQMFLGLHPTVAVVTNVEWDHPDCYPTPESFAQAFADFTQLVAQEGLTISCADDAGAEQIRTKRAWDGSPWQTYGLSVGADLWGSNVQPIAGSGYAADVAWRGASVGTLALAVPGEHNLRNALAALVVAHWCGVPFAQAAATLHTFRGTTRRFEVKGEANGVTVIDDYAHHPTEIQVTLAAAHKRYPNRRIWAIFQPHTFSRTREMMAAMSNSFHHADKVIVTDIYAAREVDDGRVTAAQLVAMSSHPHIHHVAHLEDVAAHLTHKVMPGDVVITLSAGDGYKVGDMLLARLREM